jgi:hypothetical protein
VKNAIYVQNDKTKTRSMHFLILVLLTKGRNHLTLLLLLRWINPSQPKFPNPLFPFLTIPTFRSKSSTSSQSRRNFSTKMGGGSMIRPALRPIVRPAGLRTRRIHPVDSSSSSSLPSASASFAAGVRNQSTDEPVRQVFGPVPSEPEAEEALSALVQYVNWIILEINWPFFFVCG